MGGNSRTNLPAEGGRDVRFAGLDILRRRVRGHGRDDSFSIQIGMGREERTGDLERIEQKIFFLRQVVLVLINVYMDLKQF